MNTIVKGADGTEIDQGERQKSNRKAIEDTMKNLERVLEKILKFQYVTELNWTFEGLTHHNVMLTTKERILTPNLKYYRLEDCVFKFNTPLGPRQYPSNS